MGTVFRRFSVAAYSAALFRKFSVSISLVLIDSAVGLGKSSKLSKLKDRTGT